MNKKLNGIWKRAGMITLVASLVALMAAPAFAQQRRDGRGGDDRPRLNIDIDGDRQERRERRRELRRERRMVSSVPEPTAALLFAGGGLIVAQAIRSNRRKQQK